MINDKSNSSSERETKYVFDNHSAHILIQWLKYRCYPDPEYPAGVVSSIYYDGPGWNFMREKLNSDYLKTKVRLRWYEDIDTRQSFDQTFLEVKYKIGSSRKKERLKTDFTGNWLRRINLNNRRLLDIHHLLNSRQIVLPRPLIPSLQITYIRRRFVEPVTGSRLCVDYNICAPKVNSQMLGRQNPFRLHKGVFELKGSGTCRDGTPVGANGNLDELPDVLGQLTALGCRKQSFSKYSWCYQKIMGIKF